MCGNKQVIILVLSLSKQSILVFLRLRLFLWVPFDRLPREGRRRRGGIKKEKVTDKKLSLLLVERGKGLPGGRFLNCGGEKRRWVEGGGGRGFHSPKCSQKRGGDEKQVGEEKGKELKKKEDRRMVPEQQKRFPLFLLRIYNVGSGSLRGSMEFFLHLWESEDSWKIVSDFRMHAVLVLLEPKMSIPFRGSGGESQIKKIHLPFFFPPLTSDTRNTGLLQTFLSFPPPYPSASSTQNISLPSSSPFSYSPISKVSHGPGETKREEVPYVGTSECN